MKTLFITDLDGTFLNSNAEISERSYNIIKELTEKGVLFSVATARTYATVLEMFKGIALPCPLVLMNGVTIFDPIKNQILKSNPIEEEIGNKIIAAYRKNGIEPMLYFQQKKTLDIYYGPITNEYQRAYINQRTDCKTKRFIKSETPVDIKSKNLVYIVSLERYEKLKPIYDEINTIDGARCMFYRDTYTDCWFLEIITDRVSKATGVKQVKDMLGAERVVAFGDNLNDIEMFHFADECYAVSNAHDALKKIATGIIGTNDENAVAEFILSRHNNFI